MITVLVRYGLSVRTKQYTKKNPNAKHAVKAEISISFIDSAKRLAFSAG